MEANSREYQLEQQAINVEIKSLEESIPDSFQAVSLRHRCNTVAPISSLPTKVSTTIFSILHLFDVPLAGGKGDYLAWLHVTCVCLNGVRLQSIIPLLGSH